MILTMQDPIRANDLTHTSIPTYVLGPFVIWGEYAHGEFYVPFAATEKPLIPSLNRGRKVVNLCGGANTKITKDEMTRAPLFVAKSQDIAEQLEEYVKEHFNDIKKVADSTTNYGELTSIDAQVAGSDLYLRIGMFCGDAAGHNMTTKAASAVAEHIMQEFPGKVSIGSLSSNYCIDKKPARINIEQGRGKTLEAWTVIPENILEEHLNTSGERLEELNYKKNIKGSELAGSLARNAHHANIVAAVYLATGQDIANVVEGSLGETIVETNDHETLFSVKLPCIIVGTLGGGTVLPYAQENLKLIGCQGPGKPVGANSRKLAEIIASAVLAGELSLMAALTNEDELLRAHWRYERNIFGENLVS